MEGGREGIGSVEEGMECYGRGLVEWNAVGRDLQGGRGRVDRAK